MKDLSIEERRVAFVASYNELVLLYGMQTEAYLATRSVGPQLQIEAQVRVVAIDKWQPVKAEEVQDGDDS